MTHQPGIRLVFRAAPGANPSPAVIGDVARRVTAGLRAENQRIEPVYDGTRGGDTCRWGGRTASVVRLLADAWQRAQTREELLRLFAVDAALIQAYPEIGMGLFEGFRWVDAALARG